MIYKTFLYVNFLSFNLRILLYSHYKTDTSFTFDLVPLELLSQKDLEYFFSDRSSGKLYKNPYGILLSKNLQVRNYNKFINMLFDIGATAIIVENNYTLSDSRAIYTIKTDDLRHLISIIANFDADKAKIIKNTHIKKEYDDVITLIDEFFLQIPPILLVVLLVIVWKTFTNEEDYTRRNFYVYEDFVDGVNISCQGTFCCICFEEYLEGDEIRKLGCKHYFHKHCIQSWLAGSNICPVCRIDVFRMQQSYQTEITFI